MVALCDVNQHHLEGARKRHPEARAFRDFREFHASDMDYDAVVVSTTEHTHAFAMLPALKKGKHVYSEKPLTRDVYEARVITEAAAKAGVATQMGTQIHAGDNYRRVVELVQSGAIGEVSEVHVWVSRAWGWQTQAQAESNRDIVWSAERPKDERPVPEHLDWDLWLGPAPWRPYHDIYFPGPKWYRWWDFGNGTMSDLGSHWNDLPFWALNLDAPTAVKAWGPPAHPEIAPASMSAEYTYPAREGRPGLKLTWHQGSHKPEAWTRGDIPSGAVACCLSELKACCCPITVSTFFCLKIALPLSSDPNPGFPSRSVIIRSGCMLVVRGLRPHATLVMQARLPRPITWAMWPTALASPSNGMHRQWK